MVDIETHKIVDMIESREVEDVSRWLAEYPNLRVVSRDGSLSYASSITEAHPAALQVSDRFHLIKNLTDRATLIFQKLFQGRISIPITSYTQRIKYEMLIGTTEQRVRLVKKLRAEGRTLKEIVLLSGASERMVKKYVSMRGCDITQDEPTVRGREHEEAVAKLIGRAEKVRVLHEEGLNITEITQKTGFTLAVVKNYLSADFSHINAHYGKQREGKLEPFRDEVIQWKTEGLTYREIHDRIKVKGYTGTQDAIRGFISKERRIRRDLQAMAGSEPVEFIDKKWIIRLLYKPIEKVKGITHEQLTAIFVLHPITETIMNLVNEFKTIFCTKTPDALVPWMEKALALGLPEFDAFVNSVKQDIDAVMNAITTEYSNGLIEGVINKIKLIKRVMYGRCSFQLLKNKCLLIDHL